MYKQQSKGEGVEGSRARASKAADLRRKMAHSNMRFPLALQHNPTVSIDGRTQQATFVQIPPSRVAEASNDRTTRDLLPVQVPGEGPRPTPAIVAVQRLQLVRHNTTSFLRIEVSLHLPMPRSLLAIIERLLLPIPRSLLAIIERLSSPAVLG